MLIVVKIAQNGTFIKNIFLPFYEANHSNLGDQKVDLFYVFGKIQFSLNGKKIFFTKVRFLCNLHHYY